ncbi:hypothetical protein P280DRAFT_137509 [Massarina eburnea CBS 473.64]|uniref:Uncharacterized protein n=1 Tax=Massarina eburnea CBS 473.64 TaxID=1395130 RepID=A0A6A6RPD4_9PLEO|nr:hypothetical protein P280DRAFT_137509 [Massarina eburnea CBS 473.64]
MSHSQSMFPESFCRPPKDSYPLFYGFIMYIYALCLGFVSQVELKPQSSRAWVRIPLLSSADSVFVFGCGEWCVGWSFFLVGGVGMCGGDEEH